MKHKNIYLLLWAINILFLIITLTFWIIGISKKDISYLTIYLYTLIPLIGSSWFHTYFIFKGDVFQKKLSIKYLIFLTIFIIFTVFSPPIFVIRPV